MEVFELAFHPRARNHRAEVNSLKLEVGCGGTVPSVAGEQRLAPVPGGDGVSPWALAFLKLRPSSCTTQPVECAAISLAKAIVLLNISHRTFY